MPESNQIQTMFANVAHRYDLLNHLLSFGLDFWWWRKMAKLTCPHHGMRVLDVAAGTGDSTLALAKNGATVVSTDFTMSMLRQGQKKITRAMAKNQVLGLIGADAQYLPFKNSSFDVVTICYGIRNIEHRGLAYSEFSRVLKPDGRLIILEFSHPRRRWLQWLYNLYSHYFLVKLGGLISGDSAAYIYLRDSIKNFPSQHELAQELQNAGFDDVSWQDLSIGIVALHTATKTQN